MNSNIIDIHPHVITTDEVNYPRDPLGGKQSSWSQSRPTTWQQLSEAMDEAGVAKSAVVQSSTCYGFDNSYVADAVAARPERLTGVFSVDMLAPNAPEMVRYWFERGLTGMRLFTTGSTMPGQSSVLADPRSFPAWEAARDLGIPVCVQMRPEGLHMLEMLIARFPTVTFIIDHLMSVPVEAGPPFYEAAPLMTVARHANVNLKLTIIAIRDSYKGQSTPETFIKKVVDVFGAHRIAWGSNFPASEGSLKEMIVETHQALAFLSEADRKAIMCSTAQHLYPSLKD